MYIYYVNILYIYIMYIYIMYIYIMYIYIGYLKQTKGGWSWDPMTAPSTNGAHGDQVSPRSMMAWINMCIGCSWNFIYFMPVQRVKKTDT